MLFATLFILAPRQTRPRTDHAATDSFGAWGTDLVIGVLAAILIAAPYKVWAG
jgi:hypothetical protein